MPAKFKPCLEVPAFAGSWPLHLKILVREGGGVRYFDHIEIMIGSMVAVVAGIGEEEKATFE